MNHKERVPSSTRETVPASQPAIHLSEDFEARSVQPDYYAASNGLDIYHAIQSPSEYETMYTQHILALQLDIFDPGHFRQVNRFAGQEYDGLLPPGSFFLLPARTPTFFSWNETDESIIFTLEQSALQQIAIENDCLNPSRVELLPIIYKRDLKLEFFAKSFKEEMHNKALGGRLYSDYLANLFTIHLLRHYCAFEPKLKQYQGGLSRHRLQRAIAYIQDHLAENISLAEMAQEVGMSQHHFCRLFKQSTGIAPYQYVIQQRLERAKQLLLQNKLSIAEVAQEVGFSEQSQLSRHLKRATGLTPKQLQN